MADSPSLEDRFLGCMLGHAAGDAVGAPFEGLPAESIIHGFGRPSDILAKHPVDAFFCTDDTHMAMAMAETLCACGGIDEDDLMARFVRGYDPRRGYGTGMRRLLEAAANGGDWRTMAAELFPGGSYGNGGAMRVAPVGLFFHQDLDRVWEQAGKSAATTHRHPLGVEGAQLFAMAVALAVRGEAGDRDTLFGTLYDRATQEEYQWLLRTAHRLEARDTLGFLGSSLEAHRSVVTAIACFAVSTESYVGALARALALGDDTDTLMGMAGALSGAHLGVAAVPGEYLQRMEKGERGVEYLRDLAMRLYARATSGLVE